MRKTGYRKGSDHGQEFVCRQEIRSRHVFIRLYTNILTSIVTAKRVTTSTKVLDLATKNYQLLEEETFAVQRAMAVHASLNTKLYIAPQRDRLETRRNDYIFAGGLSDTGPLFDASILVKAAAVRHKGIRSRGRFS